MTISIDWGALGIKTRAQPVRRTKKHVSRRPGPKQELTARDKAELEFTSQQIKRAKEKHEKLVAELSNAHPNFRSFIKTLDREEPQTNIDKRGHFDWDVVELAYYLKLSELSVEARWAAFREFSATMRRVYKRQYGDDNGPFIDFPHLRDTDFETMKTALDIK